MDVLFFSNNMNEQTQTCKDSIWLELCTQERLKHKTIEKQSEVQEDLLDYCRLWEIKDEEEWYSRWTTHPKKCVQKQIKKEMKWLCVYQEIDAKAIEKQIANIIHLWKKVQDYEHVWYYLFIRTFEQAIDNYNDIQSVEYCPDFKL